MGIKKAVIHEPARNEVVDAYSDHSKVRKYFSINSAPVTLDEGIKSTTDCVKAHGAKTTPKFKDIEIGINLPVSWRL